MRNLKETIVGFMEAERLLEVQAGCGRPPGRV